MLGLDPLIFWVIVGAVVLLIGLLLLTGLFTVEQQTVKLITRFGRYVRTAHTGLNWKIPILEWATKPLSLRIEQLDVPIETKTKDDVFVKTKISVQYYVIPAKADAAFYRLNNPEKQIEAYIFDVVRAEIPKMDLEEVFLKKEDIALAIKADLTKEMDEFGYGIQKTLMTDIDPDQKVKDSLNEIKAKERLEIAAKHEANADKIRKVKAAEADAESKHLQGQGVANQRRAIVDGLKDSVKSFQDETSIRSEEVMTILLMTQYFDALTDVARHSKTNTVMMPNSPNSVGGFADQIRDSIIAANKSCFPELGNDDGCGPECECKDEKPAKPEKECSCEKCKDGCPEDCDCGCHNGEPCTCDD